MSLSKLAKRCVELSYNHKLSHVSSVLNTVDLLDEIYAERKAGDPVILDNGHASLAHYVVLEKYFGKDAEMLLEKHGVHAHRDLDDGIWVSNGSLGQAATVALGMALADKERTVYLVTSDGAAMEGCIYEVLRIAMENAKNLRTYVVMNGYGAYGQVHHWQLPFWEGTVDDFEVREVGKDYPSWLQGLAGHYLILNKEQYEELMS